jgi:1-acyl-sn-glycerol-3-phosphate acyltransferase
VTTAADHGSSRGRAIDWVRPPRRHEVEAWQAIGRPLFRSLFALEPHGLDRLPLRPPYIVAANHPSYIDPLLIAAWLPEPPRPMTWDAVFRIPVVSCWARRLGAFPVTLDEGRGTLLAQRTARAILDEGGVLMIFPEGERSRPGGEMKPPRPGIGRLAAQAGCPIVCVSVLGSWNVWPHGRRCFRAGRIKLVFHEPIVLDEAERLERLRDRAYHQEIARRVHDRIGGIVDAVRSDACNRRDALTMSRVLELL